MCGILGIVAQSPVNQLLYDGLLLLQHRGQDAAGIVTAERNSFHMHKAPGMVRDVFRTRNMRSLPGNMGIAHCRYPTAGSIARSARSSASCARSSSSLPLRSPPDSPAFRGPRCGRIRSQAASSPRPQARSSPGCRRPLRSA